ncbi:unnamed protein product, partial [Strongylus vulgaris]
MIRRSTSTFATLLRNAYGVRAVPTRTFASNKEIFENAQAKLKTLTEEPDVDVKLEIYALYKQATIGDVQGSRPGMMDFAGRAKYDAWAKVKGLEQVTGRKP